jgi:hypothetical protein
MEALVTVDDLIERLPFVMDEDETREAAGALDDLSDEARLNGRASWTTQAVTPRSVQNLILRAAVRHMKNHDGFTQSRAGDETLAWTDRGHDAGSAYFTQREIKMLRAIAGRGDGFATVGMYAHTRSERSPLVGTVPDPGSNQPVRMFAGEDPW